MKSKKREKQADKQFWETFYYMNVASRNSETPFHIEKVRFRLYDYVDDDDLVRMVNGIRSVGQLDLDETDITNAGIEALVELDYVTELRLKGCSNITNEAMPFICAIKGLELLHLIGTAVDGDGFAHIGNLKHLKTLLIPKEIDSTLLEEIFVNLPKDCELIVGYKIYPFDE
jgi:hypothetical protein